MISDYHFTGQTKQGKVLNFTVHINPEEIQKDQDCDLIIRRIILDSFNISEKLSKPDIHINIMNLDVPGDKIYYEIIEEADHPVHAVAIKQFEKNKAVEDIVSKRILPVDEAKEEIGQLSLLERFAVIDKKPRGFFGKVKQVLAVFLSKILYPFHLLQKLWHTLTNQSEKQLKWDINLLAEICGVTPTDQMKMVHSLKYMSTMLDQEQEETADPILQLRFKNGLKLAQEIDETRQSFRKEASGKKIVKNIRKAITEIGDKKILIPVGYYEGDKLIEALLEVSKGTNDKYSAVFISAQDETRDLFDREMGIEIGSQSMRREITDIDSKELFAAIPTLIELQTSSSCLQDAGATWRTIFMQTLKFEKSKVEIGATTELHRGTDAPGHLGETISYVKREKTNTEESKRFDLAIRLRLFLDVCKANKKGFKDQQFWTSVRTTARYLATQIDQEKSILGSRTDQGIELTRIYGELKQLLDELDHSPPELVDLRKKVLPLVSGKLDVVTHPETPSLISIGIEPNSYPNIDPPFAVFDPTHPLESIQNWGVRCREMITQGKSEEAAREAKLMVQMLPKITDSFWSTLTPTKADFLLECFNDIGEAVARGAVAKDQSTLQDIAAMTTLNLYAYEVGCKANIGSKDALANFTITSKLILDDLLNCHLSTSDRIQFQAIKENFDKISPSYKQIFEMYTGNENENYPLLNIAQFTEMTLHGSGLASLTVSNNPIRFKLKPLFTIETLESPAKFIRWSVTLPVDPSYDSDLRPTAYKTPLPLRAPSYARDITSEVTNRYVSNFCCLGCIRDNCPNYNQVDKKDHRFHPLFMLHNYVDIFCDKLSDKGQLTRDEITDLMYTQQTNQNANVVWENVHHKEHGFEIANGFNENDRNIQFMNTFMVYLDHPHFFKQPELRWQFETKLFKYGAFSTILKDAKINLYSPFLMSMLNKLKKEISISNATDDRETAAYLIHICDELKESIESSQLTDEKKQTLLGLMPKNTETIMHNWARELVGKNDEYLLKQQAMILPLVLQSYYKKFVNNNSDPCFDSDKDLELILSAIARIEINDKLIADIDPEVRDRYLTLMSLILHKTKERVGQEAEKGDFVNKILMHIHPNVSSMRLKWDPVDFPTFLALSDSGEVYQFDLTTGKLTFKNKQSSEIPYNIKRHPGLEKLFGATLNENWNIQGTPPQSVEKIVAYTHEKYPNFRIVVGRGLSDSVVSTPKVIIERTIVAKSGEKKWVTYTEFDTQARLRENKTLSEISDLPLAVSLVIGDRTCWIDRTKNRIYVFELDSEQPYAIISLNPKKVIDHEIEVETEITDVHIIKDDTHLLSANKKEIEQYSSIEDPRFIQVLGKKHRTIIGKKYHATQVNYPRYELAASGAPLSYDIGKKGITSKAFPKYTLASNGVRPGSADPILGVTPLPATFDGFQLLKKDGDEKVLIPLRGYEQQYAVSGDPLPLSKTVFPDVFDKCPLYEFSVDQVTNRLVAKSGDAYAYLAYLNIAHWDYDSATYYLSKARTTAGYDANYDQVFQWAEKWNDETPNGLAMKLRFELFREKVLEDRQIHQIKEGKLKGAEEVLIQRAPRLIQIADLYKKYIDVIENRIAGESGIDPSLALTTEDNKVVKSLIKTLLASHGNEIINTHEPRPIRAEQIPLQQFLESDVENTLDLNTGALMIWAFNGTDRNHTPFVLKDPRWIIQNFRDLFNQVIEGDEKSIHYKQLKLQIRLISELPDGGLDPEMQLDPVERSCVKFSQSYLLKLIALKESDPKGFIELKQMLGADGKLTEFKGPFFNASRMKALGRMEDFREGREFERFALTIPRLATKAALAIIKEVRDTPFYIDVYNREGLANQIINWVENWQTNSQNKNFHDSFRSFLTKECFGSKGAKNIESLDKVFKFLEPVKIKQPTQIMKQAPANPLKPSITYREKYEKLIDSAPDNLEARIEKLEGDIAARIEPPVPQMIVTQPSKIHTVIGDGLVDKYSRYFDKMAIPTPAINQAVFDDLSHSNEKAFVRIAEKNREDLAAYLSTKTTVAITKGDALKLKGELIVERERIGYAEETLKKNLLQFVELFETPAGILAMRRLVGKGVKPSLDFLISLWRRGETAKVWDDHPLKKLGMKQIPESAAKQLDSDIAKYLELSTVHNHLNRVVDMTDSYLNTCAENNSSLGDTQLANELFEGIQTKRNYSLNSQDNKDYRDLQYVEYTQKIIMYADQIQTLREMSFDPNAVRQLRMGRGKTEVIMPILAKKKATGKNLVVLMLPEELYEANCRGLDIKNRLLFGQEMHRFDFSLKTDKSVEALQKIHVRLLQTIHDKGFIMSTKRSLLGLKNSYILLLNKLNKLQPHDDKVELLAQIREMSKIVSVFYNQADVLADEVDACLDVRKEVNFALGDSEPVDQVKVDVGADLMYLILDQKPGDPLYELRDALIHNTQAAISPEQRKQMLSDLVKIYYDIHQKQIAAIDKETFVKYIINDPLGAAAQTWVFAQKEQNNELFKQITSLKAFIDQGFGTTWGRIGNVNYGRDPISEVNTIPYKASNTPSINSEFDDDIERISFTYQDYLQNGVSYKQVYQIVAQMQKRALAELRSSESNEFFNILDTKVAKEFEVFIKEVDPEGKLGASITLAGVNDPKMIEVLVATLNATPKGRLAFCHKQVVRNMKQFRAQINSMSTEAPQLVKSFGGFTGTPWNLHTYHDKIYATPNLGVDGMTWSLMLGRKVDIKAFDFDAEKPIDSLLSNIDIVGNYQAVIDTGAYLRGTSNDEFNDRVLEIAHEKGLPVNAGIYFDESGKIVKKQYGEKPLSIEVAPVTDMMTNMTLYDQAHTVGADIKQGKKAKAVVTIGENTFIRDLFQAVWRLRQLHQEQTVILAVSNKIKERILGGEVRDLTIEDIHKFCLMNEARREADDNFKAEKEKIQGYVKRALLPEIVSVVNNQASDETIMQMAQKFVADDAQLFIKERPREEAYDEYGKIKTKESPLESFSRLRTKEAEKGQKIAAEFKQMNQTQAVIEFNKITNRIASRSNPPVDWFPNEIDTRESAGGEVEQEAQAEVEQELELMVQTTTQTQTETIKDVNIPMVQSGAAGSGDVTSLKTETLVGVVQSGKCPVLKWPCGPQVGDKVPVATGYIDVVQLRQLSANLDYFDSEIFCSEVFERNLPLEAKKVSPQCVFYSNRKPVKSVLISKYEGQWTMIIPTIHEGHDVCRKFIEEVSPNVKTVEVAVSASKPLIMYKNGDDRSDALPFADKDDEDQFYRLYIQAKLFNGEIEYGSKEEQDALKIWLTKKGKVAEFKKYFEQNILAAKPRRVADAYLKSILLKIFNELIEALPASS